MELLTVTKESVDWIVKNAKTSMYDNNRSYIYNKAYFNEFLSDVKKVSKQAAQEYQDYLTALALRTKNNVNGFHENGQDTTRIKMLKIEWKEIDFN